MADPVLVHMGLAKTGTTTLQQDVFSRASGVAYLGKTLVPEPLDQARRSLARDAEGRFDAAATARLFADHRARHPGPAVYSDEDLSVWKFLDPAVMGGRIGQVFPGHRLLYVVRRPRDWVMSQYFFRLGAGRPDTLDGPSAWLRAHLDRLGVGSDVGELRFTETFRRFRRAAGDGDFLVLPYERMAADIGGFLDQVSGFLGLGEGGLPVPDAQPRKARIGERMADFHRLPALLRRDRAAFLERAEAVRAVAIARERKRFDELAADPDASEADWRDWLGVAARWVEPALAAADPALTEALSLHDDYALTPDLLARLDAIAAEETEAMAAEFGVDLRPWGYP